MSEFKAGDLVVLKSGGPVMVMEPVKGEDHNAHANCTWFNDQAGIYQTEDFNLLMLNKVEV